MELKELISPLLKWWWLLVASTLVAAVSSFIAVSQQPPTYSAATSLMIGNAIEDPNPNGTNLWLSQQLAASYADIARRAPVRQATMAALGLTWLPEYVTRPVQNTTLLEIAVTDTDPVRAQAVANELAHQLILASPTYSDESQARQQFISEQLDDLEIKIRETQTEITTKQDELASMVSARQIADTQGQINALQGKLTTLQSNYASLLINTQQGAVNALTVIEPAQPGYQVGPNKPMTVLTSAAIGLVLAAGAAYLLEYLDNTVRGPEEVKRLTGLATLAGIAQFPGEHYNEKLITVLHPRDPVSEAYRSLRTAIQFSTIDTPEHSVLMVTSPNPTEGKSTTVANLAVVFAQAGHRVLVVDADLRRPVQHRIFELPNGRGLTNFLLEVKTNRLDEEVDLLEEWTIQKSSTENLYVLTSGPIPPNPSELLSSTKMKQALASLAQRFDYVLMDSPPTMVVTDAAILSQHADGVALVIDFDKTARQHLKQAVEYLREVNANLLGVVINRLSNRGDGYYYYYYYRKSYYHEGDQASSNGRGPLGTLGQLLPQALTQKLGQWLGLQDDYGKARRSGRSSGRSGGSSRGSSSGSRGGSSRQSGRSSGQKAKGSRSGGQRPPGVGGSRSLKEGGQPAVPPFDESGED